MPRVVEEYTEKLQQISVAGWTGPLRSVALCIARETSETAALPLSYVGRTATIADALRQQLFARSTPNGPRTDSHKTTPE